MTEVWVDVSKYQGTPDWQAVKASGVSGAVINCDEPGFVDQVRAVLSAGMKVASYHFTNTGSGDPHAAAQHHLAQIAPVKGSLSFVAGDHESGSGDLTDWCTSYQETLSGGFGRPAWFYTGGWWTAAHIRHDATALRRYPLWDAAYTGTEPAAPAPWTSIAMWQHTSSAHRPGISGDVDEDYLYVTEQPTPPPPQPPTPKHHPLEDTMLLFVIDEHPNPVYVVNAEGKRHIATQRELDAWTRAGVYGEQILRAEIDKIPTIPGAPA